MKSEDNVLLDYSYAGYNHGESAPADGFAWGYKVINVKERMENDNLSAREALNLILYEINWYVNVLERRIIRIQTLLQNRNLFPGW